MLTQDIKRKIDSARNILVGKVPDPKAQVEQITLALIYKFMDDMDKQAMMLPKGRAQFFTNGYEQYAWNKLMDPRLGGQERLDLYVRSISELSKNPHLPQLFRDIYKNAFLPFRDPATLNLFLKEINSFEYDHSENLGDAFEYLLSILGSQGDAGQFRTPRHIIDFIAEVVNPKKNETVLDPACGTAGFLISAYKHILAAHDGKNDPEHKEIPLTPDERKKLMTNLAGYDISPDMVKLSLVNLYLHGFPNPNIYEYDTLASEDRWDEHFDVIMANPPFMSPKGGIRPHKRFSVQANRSEVLFVDYIMEHLNPKGRAGIIVPEGIIFQSAGAYKQLRKLLVEDGLFAVVSLPAGVFNPYSGVKTSVLFFDKENAKKTTDILFLKVNNDGFDLGAQRRKIEKNDLPEAIDVLKQWRNSKKIESTIAHFVPKSKIVESGDYNLSGERYKEVVAHTNQKWPMVEVGEIAEVIAGQSPEGKYYNSTSDGLPFYQGKTEFGNIYLGDPTTWTSKTTRIAEKGDILMSVRAPVGPVNIATQKICIGRGLAAIRAGKDVERMFLFYNLRAMQDKITGNSGAVFDSINKSQIEKIKIPLPPLEIQKEIVEQIEKYQNIVDGAKQIISNYRPTIKVDSSWQIIELGNLFLDTKLGLVKDKSMQDDIFPYPYIKMENISIDGNLELNSVAHVEANKEELEKYTLNDGDFIYNTRNAPNLVGKSSVYHGENGKYLFNNNILRIRFRKEVDPDYINYYLNTEEGKQKIKTLVSGTTSVAAIYQKNFATIAVHIPPIEVQKEIVAEISKEKECVHASVKTINVFEKKISQLINDIL